MRGPRRLARSAAQVHQINEMGYEPYLVDSRHVSSNKSPKPALEVLFIAPVCVERSVPASSMISRFRSSPSLAIASWNEL